jgi:hypothetical protein
LGNSSERYPELADWPLILGQESRGQFPQIAEQQRDKADESRVLNAHMEMVFQQSITPYAR